MGAWLEIRAGGEGRRHVLAPGLTRIGGTGAGARRADVPLPAGAQGELHVWDDPPKAVRVSGPPLVGGGEARDELALSDGTRFRWGELELRYGCDPPVLEELPLEEDPALAPAVRAEVRAEVRADVRAATSAERRAWRRVQAGLLVELGLADRQVVRSWQESVKSGTFDADACSRELLAGSRFDAADPRLVDRCGALLRDFLMAPLLRGARGAGRRARGAAKSGFAFLIAQLVAILVYSLLVAALLILVRAKWEVSLDGWIDALLGLG